MVNITTKNTRVKPFVVNTNNTIDLGKGSCQPTTPPLANRLASTSSLRPYVPSVRPYLPSAVGILNSAGMMSVFFANQLQYSSEHPSSADDGYCNYVCGLSNTMIWLGISTVVSIGLAITTKLVLTHAFPVPTVHEEDTSKLV